MIKNYLSLLFLFLALSACLPDDSTFENFRRNELRYMLSNNSEKKWLVDSRVVNNEPVELNACDSARQLIFRFTSSSTDKDSLFYINRDPQCEDSATVQAGYWYIPTTNVTPPGVTDSLFLVWEDAAPIAYKITDITPASFQIESFLRSTPFQETFVLPDSVGL